MVFSLIRKIHTQRISNDRNFKSVITGLKLVENSIQFYLYFESVT